jgi:hypothetical protein
MPDRMQSLKLPACSLRFVLAVLLMAGWCAVAGAQDKPDGAQKPEIQDVTPRPENDGHDRPTTYPKIRFTNKGGGKPAGEGVEAAAKKLKTRVYLLDVSASMSKSITIDSTRESTRLEHMVSQMESSLDSLANRRDPNLRFNMVTFGTVQDFAGGGELQPVTVETVRRAKEWLGKLEAEGDSDIYSMLKECFKQDPGTATLLVGSLPSKPEGVDEKEYKKYKDAGEYLIARVKVWRGEEGKTTTLDITGIGLSEDEKAYYRKLAEAAGGTYLDA